jgi:hypothetical protein
MLSTTQEWICRHMKWLCMKLEKYSASDQVRLRRLNKDPVKILGQ